MDRLTQQEKFWISKQGDDYIDRNLKSRMEMRRKLWKEVLEKTSDIKSILEIGCNIGLNLKEINKINPNINLHGIEINQKAAKIAGKNDFINVKCESILTYKPENKYDMCFTSGVLIHINPENLDNVYSIIDQSASKYVLFNENYSKKPNNISYRKRNDLLFTRDFANDFIKKYNHWELIERGDYFTYNRLLKFLPNNRDIKWFLLKRKSPRTLSLLSSAL